MHHPKRDLEKRIEAVVESRTETQDNQPINPMEYPALAQLNQALVFGSKDVDWDVLIPQAQKVYDEIYSHIEGRIHDLTHRDEIGMRSSQQRDGVQPFTLRSYTDGVLAQAAAGNYEGVSKILGDLASVAPEKGEVYMKAFNELHVLKDAMHIIQQAKENRNPQ